MFAISAILGAKYYPIPYRWGRLLSIMLLMGAIYGISLITDRSFTLGLGATLAVNTVLLAAYMAGAWMIIAGHDRHNP